MNKNTMQPVIGISLIIIALFLSLSSLSQTKNTQPAANTKQAGTSRPAPQGNAIDSLKNAFNNIKSLFGKKKGGDTITLLVSDIEYEDSNLTVLKEDLRITKGVKNVVMNYKSGNAIFDIVFKGKPSELWDAQPRDARQSFKLVEAGEKNLVLAYKRIRN